MNKTFGFLGCGNMGTALLASMVKSVSPQQIFAADADEEKAQAASLQYEVVAASVKKTALQCDYLFLGVKPQILPALFSEIAPVLRERKDRFVLVSMAAGVEIAKILSLAGADYPCIRIMPNMPVSVGSGMILYTENEAVTAEELSDFLFALKGAGRLDRIAEDKIDAASSVSGCGPAFAFLFLEAMADGGVACGLPRDKALLYAAQTLSGSAQMLLQTGRHPGALKDAVCSPAGSTIEGVRALEDGAFRADTIHAVTAAYIRTLELGK